MSGQVSETQIYLFLADYGSNWRNDADKLDKEDGNVTKHEFKKFLVEEMDGWNGVDISQLSHSVIDNFFAKLDTNDVGSNFNKLDSKELDGMECNIKAYQVLNDYITDKFKNDYPTDVLNTKYSTSWKWELSDSLTQVIETCISTKNTDEAAIKAALDKNYPQSFALATAQCCVAQYTESNNIKNMLADLSNNYDYKIADDNDLANILKNWIENNLSASMDAKAINNGVKSIVDGYLATAGLGNGNPDAVKDLGYNPAKLNEIQKAQLNKEVATDLDGKMNEFNITDRAGNAIDLSKFSEQYKAAITKFISNYKLPSNVKVEEGMSKFDAMLNHLRANVKTEFENSTEFKNFRNNVQLQTHCMGVSADSDLIKFLKSKGMTDEQINELLPKISNPETCKTEYPEYYKEYCKIMNSINRGEATYLQGDGTLNYDLINDTLLKIFQLELDAAAEKRAAEAAHINWGELTDASYGCSIIVPNQNGQMICWQPGSYSLNTLYNSAGGQHRLALTSTDDFGFTAGGDWHGNIDIAKAKVTAFVGYIKNACASSGKYDDAALETARNKVTSIYTQALEKAKGEWPGDGHCQNNELITEDGTFSYTTKAYGQGTDAAVNTKFGEGGSLGLCISEELHGSKQYQITVDAKVLMDLFAHFYEQVLGN